MFLDDDIQKKKKRVENHGEKMKILCIQILLKVQLKHEEQLVILKVVCRFLFFKLYLSYRGFKNLIKTA